MQEFIYVLKPNRPVMLIDGANAGETQILERHLAYLNGLLAKDRAILFGRTQTTDIDTFGIVIFEAGNQADAMETMNADPAVSAGVMSARLFPHKVTGLRSK